MQTGIGNAHDTYAVAVRNIIDGDIKTMESNQCQKYTASISSLEH